MAMTLLDTNSGSQTTSVFTSGIDSTYKLYIFKFYNYNPDTDSTNLLVQFDAAGGSGYDETITTTVFKAYHNEGDSDIGFSYQTAQDQAQGDAFQLITQNTGGGADESAAGEMYLFNPSNTTYVKHFHLRTVSYHASDYIMDHHIGGYINTTTAIDKVQFKPSSGDMDIVIKMYGVG